MLEHLVHCNLLLEVGLRDLLLVEDLDCNVVFRVPVYPQLYPV